MSGHGYGPYTHGCRCEICRAAKAEYMRDRRRDARAQASARAAIEEHGTRAGYEEHGCRCDECITAHADMYRRYWPHRAAKRDARRIRELNDELRKARL